MICGFKVTRETVRDPSSLNTISFRVIVGTGEPVYSDAFRH
jgi:hypothetical protein